MFKKSRVDVKDIPNIWENKKCSKPPSSYIFLPGRSREFMIHGLHGLVCWGKSGNIYGPWFNGVILHDVAMLNPEIY